MAERHKLYSFDYSTGKIGFLGRICPKCGKVMATHHDRFNCGYCGYTIFVKKR
ncbi:MAG: 30S ribosomal protein S27ae [archaeon GBS-70-058]|nr:30S ribosomal protein S27ae [Candidatus Culexarchaeum nevadense]